MVASLVALKNCSSGAFGLGFVPGERREQLRGLRRRQLREGHLNRRRLSASSKARPASTPLGRVVRLGQEQIDVVGNARVTRARRMLVGGNDRLGQRVERGVLRGGQERQLRRRLVA